jgi:hypothetical protein
MSAHEPKNPVVTTKSPIMGNRSSIGKITAHDKHKLPRFELEVKGPLIYKVGVTVDFTGVQLREDHLPDEEVSIFSGLVQWVKKLKREYTYSGGAVIEDYIASLPARDGEGRTSPSYDPLFVQKPKREVSGPVLELIPESPAGTVVLTDVPTATAAWNLKKDFPQFAHDQFLTKIEMEDEFITAAVWSIDGDEVEEYISWVSWKTDVAATVDFDLFDGDSSKVTKGEIKITGGGLGEPPGELETGGPVVYDGGWLRRVKKYS